MTVDGKTSSDIEINFDFDARKAAIIIETMNLQNHYVFDYDTNEIHVITCKLFSKEVELSNLTLLISYFFPESSSS